MGEYFEVEAGKIMGEIGVIYKQKRSAYVRSEHYSILSQLSANDYDVLVNQDNVFKRAIKSQLETYIDIKT